MACGARSGLKLLFPGRQADIFGWLNGLGSPFGIEISRNTTVALVERKPELSPPRNLASKRAASSDGLAMWRRPAPRPRRSAPESVPNADCNCDCGSVDARARPREAR